MKKFYLIILVILYTNFFIPGITNASHILASTISYSYVSPNKYLVHLDLYRDCSGILISPTQDICFFSDSLNINGTSTAYLLPGYPIQIPLQPVLPNTGLSTCNGGVDFGVELYKFEAIVQLPSASDDWVFNYKIDLGYSSFPLHIYEAIAATLDNIHFAINSSPVLLYDPLFILCVNQMVGENFSCTDADGDSIEYALYAIQMDSGNCPPIYYPYDYMPGFSATYPCQSAIPFQFDNLHNLIYQPTQQYVSEFGVSIKEIRNGQVMDSIMRIETILVTSGCIPTGINENLSFDNDLNSVGLLTIYDQAGRQLLKKNNISEKDIEKIELPPGYYLYSIVRNERLIKNGKLIR